MKQLPDGREVMGRNEYARHRGDAPNAVRKAEQSGRIAKAVIRDADGTFVGIDWRQADELWAHNTDGDQAARAKSAAPSSAAGAATAAGADATPADRDPHGLQQARATTAQYQARQAELDYLRSIGALVSTEDLKTVGARRYRALRDRLRAIPDRVSATLAAEREQAQVHATLAKEIDRVLYELSDEARAEAARGAAERVAA